MTSIEHREALSAKRDAYLCFALKCGLQTALMFFFIAGCQSETPPDTPQRIDNAASQIQFRNATETWKLNSTYWNGREGGMYAIVESLGGGAGVIDIDGDDWPDVVLPGGGKLSGGSSPNISGLPHSCWRNLRGDSMQNITAECKVDSAAYYSHGVSVGDANNDGFADFLITGFGGVEMWINNGDGTFELDASSIDDPSWSSSAGWGDIDGDGTIDLYVAHYTDWSLQNNPVCPCPSPEYEQDICAPRRFNGLDDAVFQNDGSGGFVNKSREWGLEREGKGLGVLLADLDHDSDLDIYVANDTTNNFVYMNQGNGQLQETGLLSGGAVDSEGRPNGSMGIAYFDFDHDQQGDLWVTNFEQESCALYKNVGEGNFLHVSRNTGIAALSGLYVSFGTVARDFDGDGDQDIVVANGHVIYHPNKAPFAQQSLVLQNQNGEKFSRLQMPKESFFSEQHPSRGLAAGDLNRDGRTDLIVTQLNGPAQILLNETPLKAHPLRIQLRGTLCNRDATGARIVIHYPNADRTSYLVGGGSYLSASESCCEFFLPSDLKEVSVTVHWPNGGTQEISGCCDDHSWVIVQGRNVPIVLPD